jgi:hypothetical protein
LRCRALRVTAAATPYLSGLERHLPMTLNPDGVLAIRGVAKPSSADDA